MCGIFFWLSNQPESNLESKSITIQHRGPDHQKKFNFKLGDKYGFMHFFRLAIMDLSPKGNQPFSDGQIHVMCNGEIYNAFDLAKEYNITLNSHCDCEVLIPLYRKLGFQGLVEKLDGVFAIILVDTKTQTIYIARDWVGVRPLYMLTHENGWAWSSELKPFGRAKAHQFPPQHFWDSKSQSFTKYSPPLTMEPLEQTHCATLTMAQAAVQELLSKAVAKRLITDRPLGCFLSGGLDSSLICALVVRQYLQAHMNKKASDIQTFAIGMPGSPDLVAAQKVADFLGTTHHNVLVEEKDFLQALPETIRVIESFDTTTVRASVGMYLLSKYVKENTEVKVLFSGEGADEVAQGYLYFHYQPNKQAGDQESKRLIKDLHFFDVLRADRTTAYWGLELRVPFLDHTFVQTFLNLDAAFRKPHMGIEKWLIRSSFQEFKLLPEEILWRTKEAFSDGVSHTKKSWYEIIQDHVKPLSEAEYYIKEFTKYYAPHVIPYYWLPKWINCNDPSARKLSVYKKK